MIIECIRYSEGAFSLSPSRTGADASPLVPQRGDPTASNSGRHTRQASLKFREHRVENRGVLRSKHPNIQPVICCTIVERPKITKSKTPPVLPGIMLISLCFISPLSSQRYLPSLRIVGLALKCRSDQRSPTSPPSLFYCTKTLRPIPSTRNCDHSEAFLNDQGIHTSSLRKLSPSKC